MNNNNFLDRIFNITDPVANSIIKVLMELYKYNKICNIGNE